MADASPDDLYLTKKADFARRIVIPLLGVAIIMTNGYGLLNDVAIRDTLISSDVLTCFSHVTPRRLKGRYTILYFEDMAGNVIRSCADFECSYRGWGADEGKLGKICYSGKALVSVEIEGALRLAREDRLEELNRRICLRTLIFSVGLICVGVSAFIERKTLRSMIRLR